MTERDIAALAESDGLQSLWRCKSRSVSPRTDEHRILTDASRAP